MSRYDKFVRQVGQNIRKARQEKGWTLERLEEASGIGWQQIQKIETGQNFTIRTLARIAEGLGVRPANLLNIN